MVSVEKFDSEFGFFKKLIEIESLFVSNDFKLTKAQSEFLALCCVFNYNGGDTGDHKELSEFIMNYNPKRYKSPKIVSDYKTKISEKKWIRSTWGTFELLSVLDKKKEDFPKLRKVFDLQYG